MLLSITLDPAVDSPAVAEQAISLICSAFHLVGVVSLRTAGEVEHAFQSTTPADLDPSTIGFGSSGELSASGAITVTRDTNTGALTAAQAPGVVVDEDGLPWDARIHVSTKTKNQDKRWKKKKNVDAAEVARVEAELRSIMAIPAPVANPTVSGVVVPTVVPPPPAVAAPPPAVAAPPPPPAEQTAPPAVAAPPPPPAVVEVMTFSKLMGWVGPRMASGALTATKVAETMQTLGIVDGNGNGQLALLAARPDLVAGAYDALRAAAGES